MDLIAYGAMLISAGIACTAQGSWLLQQGSEMFRAGDFLMAEALESGPILGNIDAAFAALLMHSGLNMMSVGKSGIAYGVGAIALGLTLELVGVMQESDDGGSITSNSDHMLL